MVHESVKEYVCTKWSSLACSADVVVVFFCSAGAPNMKYGLEVMKTPKIESKAVKKGIIFLFGGILYRKDTKYYEPEIFSLQARIRNIVKGSFSTTLAARMINNELL